MNYQEMKKNSEEEKVRIYKAMSAVKDQNLPASYLQILERDLEKEEKKLQELNNNYDNIAGCKTDPYSSWSSTRNLDGTITIHNKTPEEAEYIIKKFFKGDNVV